METGLVVLNDGVAIADERDRILPSSTNPLTSRKHGLPATLETLKSDHQNQSPYNKSI
jgi:hypothetical protein